ncbi:hypothetical protein BON30_43915 [Cystobacter ferrugineus]|uniref:Uncharacterized protein n=1 Tax=Cystobacter ferrugineus TaxID=83449 RepID=A0A1L9AWS3_9BACT|nr:hypothetical protein BON30_43915 [Cystobacter ferrugineus]
MTGGATLAAAGGVVLVCLTVTVALNGTESPIADRFYGTHFGDALGWMQGRYAARDAGSSMAIELHVSIHRSADGEVCAGVNSTHKQDTKG